ncbi:MAG TPA: replicative DNA helicase [Rhizomicrobium sp.]|nr:replicative DNA helicase [Rhizomicrobium sp.]
MEQEAYRHVPYDIEVEQALLGSILVDNHVLERVTSLLKSEEFYDPMHQRVYQAMVLTWERGSVITPLTLHAALKADPGLIEVGGHAYLAGLAQAAPALANVRDLARILHDLSVRRSLIRIGEDMVNTSYEAPLDMTPAQQIETAEKALYQVAENSRYGEGALDFAAALQSVAESAERAQRLGGQISGVTTGFADLDKAISGLQKSDLLILAGRPGMGKTSLATNIAFNAAVRYMHDTRDGLETPRGAPVAFFSLEMASQQLAARILSEQAEIEMWQIRTGKFSDDQWSKFVRAMQEISELPLFIDDTGGISIAQIAARSRRLKREKKIGLIVIDYLQLIAPSRRAENRVQELTEVTKGLKTLAKELDVPVLALSQLSRSVESRDDKRPMLSDLRESGSIEQDADVVMFIYREEYYLKNREPDVTSDEHAKWLAKCEAAHGKADLLIEKHRHGATRTIDLQFDERYTRFSDLAKDVVPPPR